MPNILDGTGNRRWRAMADRCAASLKLGHVKPDSRDRFFLGFLFNDATIKVSVPLTTVEELNTQELGQFIYDAVLEQVQKSKH